MGKLFFACHKNTLFDSKSSACLSLTLHHLRCHSDPRNFVRFLSVGKCRRFPQKTPKLFPSHPSEFFQRFTPRFLPTSHYFGLFICTSPSQFILRLLYPVPVLPIPSNNFRPLITFLACRSPHHLIRWW